MRPQRRRLQGKQDQRTGDPANAAAVRVPHDAVNETVLIAAVIVDAGARAQYLTTIPPSFMFGPGHALIWATLQTIAKMGLHYDPATLKQLGGADVDVQYVEGLIAQRPALPPNLAHHVEMLRWDAARIATANGAVTSFLELLKDPNTDPLTLRGAAVQIVTGLASGTNHSLRNPTQLIDAHMLKLDARQAEGACYPFGLPGLDEYGPDDYEMVDGRRISLEGEPRLVPGCSPGTMTVVTGVSGSGKTTGTVRAILNQAKAGRRITYGAYEQGSGMTLELLATMELGLSRTDMLTGRFDAEDKRRLRETMERLSANVIFDELPRDNFDERRQRYANMRAVDRIVQSIIDSRCDVFVADLFRRTMSELDPDDEERVLYRLQQVAADQQVHLILVQQQNLKYVEASKTKMPTRDFIKGSGAWVEVPDQIIAFHRPALWRNVPDDRINSLILKQRYGKWPQQVEHPYNGTFGSIGLGRTIEMKHAGEEETSDFWAPKTSKKAAEN